jgi:hypothetical protein
VADAPGTRLPLITAGNVDDETHAAFHIQAGADERVTVWNVEGADHSAGTRHRRVNVGLFSRSLTST